MLGAGVRVETAAHIAMHGCSFRDNDGSTSPGKLYGPGGSVIFAGLVDDPPAAVLVDSCTFERNVGHSVAIGAFATAYVYSNGALDTYDWGAKGPAALQSPSSAAVDTFLNDTNPWVVLTKQACVHVHSALVA
jgi:hypothetical protein